MNLLAACAVVELRPEDERIGSLRVGRGARVEGRRVGWVAALDENGRRVVLRIEGTFGLSVGANGVNVVARNGEI